MGNVVKGLFGSPSESKSEQSSAQPTSWNTLPQFAQSAFQDAVTRAQTASQNPSMFAPAALNEDQLKAASMIREGYTPIDANSFGSALQTFQNPFEEQVVQNSLRDVRNTGQGLLNDLGTGATSAGGFGGTRQAVLESDLIGQMSKAAGDVSANVRSQGYESAAQRALDSIAVNNATKNQFQMDLGGLGDFLNSFQTQTQQAPLKAIEYLLSAAQGIPVGGGTTSSGSSRATGDDPGLFGRMANIFGSLQGGK